MSAGADGPGSAPPLIVSGALIIPYKYALGESASRFYVDLRDHRRLMAVRCSSCSRTYMPPVATCIDCFAANTEWIEVGPAGVVTTYTVDHRDLTMQPHPAPVIYALIRLDGADTDLLHLLGEVEPSAVQMGMRVRAVFSEARDGNILDIQHFVPDGAPKD